MTSYIIKLVYRNEVKGTMVIHAENQSQAENIASAIADRSLGLLADYDKYAVELFFIDNPRHQVLFKGVE